MKTETSAGGVVVKKIDGQTHVLLITDRLGDWMLPKGHIEKDETLQEAATREIAEETGQTHLGLITTLPSVHYPLHRGEIQVDKTIHFFLFEETQDEALIPHVGEGITEAGWFPLDEARKKIAYPDSYQPVLDEALQYLENHPL